MQKTDPLMPALSRMQFLRGEFRAGPAAMRPPWAWQESVFTDKCIRCDRCRLACPTGILVAGRGGFPQVDFAKGECTFCGECLKTCLDGAFDLAAFDQGVSSAWPLRAHIGDACLTAQKVVCRSCGEVCEPRAIRFKPALGGVSHPGLDVGACTGCGACVAVCPASAITVSATQSATDAVEETA